MIFVEVPNKNKEESAAGNQASVVVSLPLQLVTAIDDLLCELNKNGCGGEYELANTCRHLSMAINHELAVAI